MKIYLRWAAENAVWNSDIKPTVTIILWIEEPIVTAGYLFDIRQEYI